MSELHPLLKRQLKRLQIDQKSTLTHEELNKLLQKVSESYTQFDAHIERQDNILEVSDREYREVFNSLERFNTKLTQIIEEKSIQLLARENSIENQKYVALGEMAAGIAHEINNPLAIIVSTASTIRTHIEREKIDLNKTLEKVDRIRQVSFRIAKIIEGIAVFSRQSKGEKTKLTKLSQIISDTLLLCSEKLKSVGIELKFDISKFDFLVDVRSVQISQIILNLINNAVDALEKHDKVKEIEIDSDIKGDFVCLRVFDSGPGIPDSVKERIMEPFFTTKEVGKGTGLGLSISLGIARSHGGDLLINSDFERTCFELRIPIFIAEKKVS